MISTLIAIVLASILFSAFFSGMEIAYISSNKLQIELQNKQGDFASRLLSHLMTQPSRFIATMLVGNNIALVVYGIFMAQWIEPTLYRFLANDVAVLLIQTLFSTLVILILAEYVPKAIFALYSNQLLRIFALPVLLLYYVLFPVVGLIMGISRFLLKVIFRADANDEKPMFSRIDLDNYVRQHTEDDSRDDVENEVQIFQNALDFGKVKARECMVPRTELVAMEVGDSIEELRKRFIDTGLGKILIYKENLDNIIGYVHSFELFKKPKQIRSILLPLSMVPESMPASEVLNLLIRERKSLAIVLDEFGGTSGLITIEDVIEEIFGEIEDEHDSQDLIEETLSENKYLFSARHEIDYLNEKYKLDLPESEQYETLGGLITHHYESIPEKDEVIVINPFIFTIKSSHNTRIDEVILRVKEEE
ncbi:MAG: HlyC/CorC family transporter [Flavobacteriales bacterium]|nr:HlyC/CorC family transporter [Flavobacteriales bacterium]